MKTFAPLAVIGLLASVLCAQTVTLPVEVLGQPNTVVTVAAPIPSGTNVSQPMYLWLKIHGLRFQTQAAVRVNSSTWQPINAAATNILGNANAYGGIGGGFATLTMLMNVPSGSLVAGSNTISFVFLGTDGRVSGFRVLSYNIVDASGTPYIPVSTFVADDPSTWTPPLNDPTDIAAGQTLWHTASLVDMTGAAITAHCADCHAQDGRDLKYFNYSNNSIETRAAWHGLTPTEGQQVASYIRSLTTPNPGRVWNPPYQPGPGLDSGPVTNWAAGAGLSAVESSDAGILTAIFPSGITSTSPVFAPTYNLNLRETPIDLQLPDWNQWLPGTFPGDAFSSFTTNRYYTDYLALSGALVAGNASVYAAQKPNFDNWFGDFESFQNLVGTPIWNASAFTVANDDALYSISQWGMVKSWELNQQFQLEDMAQSIFGPQADQRAWFSNLPFFTAPHEFKVPTTGAPGIRNGTEAEYIYLTNVWYNVQGILNAGNGQQSAQFPVDWSYSYQFVENLGQLLEPNDGLYTLWQLKGLEQANLQGGPQNGLNGWQPFEAQISYLITTEWNLYVWDGVSSATRAAIADGLAISWLSEVMQFTPSDWYTGGWASATYVPSSNGYDGVFGDWVWYMIPRLAFIGVDSTTITGLSNWAQTVWPLGNWMQDSTQTCTLDTNPNYPEIICPY